MSSFILSLIFLITFSPVLSSTVFLDKKEQNENDGFKIQFPYSLGPKITAESALALDLNSGQVCFSKNKEKVLSIASITKLMTTLVFLENNKLDFEQEIKIEPQDIISNSASLKDLEPASLNIKPGQRIKLKDIFNAGLIRSANDAMKILARLIEINSEKSFVDLMNEKAISLGMTNSFFVEPTGLNFENKSTAEDLVKLIFSAFKKEEIKTALNTPIYDFSVYDFGKISYQRVWNTNELLNSFINLKEAKTGYLNESGYCLVGISDYQNKQFLVVILNSATSQSRFQEAKSLIWWSEKNCFDKQ